MVTPFQEVKTAMVAPLPSEQGHYYHRDGSPAYTVISKNGLERPTTLRDARKLDLVPSTTTITRIMAAPGLENWKAEQVLWSALTLTRQEGETDEQFIARIKLDSKEKGRQAAERGTELHGAIECWIQGKPFDPKWQRHIDAVNTKLLAIGIDLKEGQCEHSFATDDYGGKCDYHTSEVILDFKSKAEIQDGKKMAWDEHCIQLSSYAHGLGLQNARCINVFVGAEDARVVIHEWTPEETTRGFSMFKLLLQLWKLKNRVV